MTNPIIHRGEIVEKILRKSGYPLTKLAEKLGISRNTLYNRFEKADLNYRFIMEVGKVLCYDFTIHFPELKEEFPTIRVDQAKHLKRAESKHTELMEKYARLLGILVKVANENELPDLHQEIAQMLEKEKGGKV